MDQMVIGGYRAFDDLGLKLLRDMQLGEPEPKFEYIDIPGGNGVIDLTEASAGDVLYSNREHSFSFDVDGDFEAERTRIANLIHGRRLEYTVPVDPGYVYTGRFRLDESAEIRPGRGRIKLSVDADPYKLKETCTYRLNAAGGIVVTLESGRMPVCPVFEFASETIIACGEVYARMQPGSYKVNDLWFREGVNEIYINSYLGHGNVAAERYADAAVSDYAARRISDLIWEGVRSGAVIASDWALDTVMMHGDERIADSAFAVGAEDERYAVYVQYDWKDL